jgi:AraC-like DNA-binding protein
MNVQSELGHYPATQRVGGLVEVPPLLRELGADPRRVLADAGLDAEALDDMENRIDTDVIDAMFDACLHHTGCPHFGLLAGQRWTIAHMGVLGELMQSAPTIGDALRDFSVLQHVNSDFGAAFLLHTGATAEFGYALYGSDLRNSEQVYDCAMAVALGILRSLCRLHFAPMAILLTRPVPRDLAPYRTAFGTRVRFDQVYSAVTFSSQWLGRPTPEADTERHDALLRAVAEQDNPHLVSRLHRALRLLLIVGRCCGDDLAALMALHRRTLNRRLEAHGTTYQKLLDGVRFDVARQLLGHTHTSVDEVASALCYADASAFTHAFRRWAGMTPGQYREQQQVGASASSG